MDMQFFDENALKALIRRFSTSSDPYAREDELPEHLAEGKSNREQIRMCFEASKKTGSQSLTDVPKSRS